METKPEKIGLIVEGGMGDNLMHTVAIRVLRNTYPDAKIGVACVYPQLLKYNPNIDELFDARMAMGFYEKYCLGNRNFAFHPKPYESRLYAYGNKHYIDYVCDDCNVKSDSHKLDLDLTRLEDEDAKSFVEQMKKETKKPFVLFQPTASFDPVNHRKIIRLKDYPMRLCRELAEILKDKVHFVQTGFPEEEKVGGPTIFSPDIRKVAALVKYCDSFVTVDSNIGHLSAVWEKKGIVLWGRTNPRAFSYTHNVNIFKDGVCPIQPCGRPEGGFFDMMISDDCNQGLHLPWDCPHVNCMFAINPQEIADNLMKVLEEKK